MNTATATPYSPEQGATLEEAREALFALDPDCDRADWVKIGMAAKAAGLDFDDFDRWSAGGRTYKPKDVQAVWKSFSPSGGVTERTLFKLARDAGWRPERSAPISPEEAARRQAQAERRRLEREASRQKEEAEAERRRQETATLAARLWDAATPVTPGDPHPYLERKGVLTDRLREIPAEEAARILGWRPEAGERGALAGRLLVIPLERDGAIATCELIDGDGRKTSLPGQGTKSGTFWPVCGLPDGNGDGATILVGEGAATALSAHAATGYPAIAVSGIANLRRAAEAMRTRYPAARVIVLADLDKESGTPCAAAIKAAKEAGSMLAAPCFGEERPEGATDFNDMHQAQGLAAVRQAIEAAAELEEPNARKAERQPYAGGFFVVSDRGVEWVSEDGDTRYWLCAELRILAATRNGSGKAWGRLLEWRDADGRVHRQALPAEMLQGDGTDVRRVLADGGLTIAPGRKARELLLAYLQAWRQDARARCVERCGWDGGVFVLPDEAIGAEGEPVVFQGTAAPSLMQSGSLEEWKEHVATLARGNSRLIFALGVALAAPLLELIGEDSGGFHFRGASSCGKTTALRLAASVWSKPDAYMRTWRATSNGLESIAQAHNHLLLVLDELRQLAANEAAETSYLLGNGQGKSRANRSGGAREPARWRLLFLSSGEIGLSDLIAQVGRRTYAGEAVRFADIAADAGAGFGLFEDCHGMTSAAFAERLRAAANTHYGTIGREWLQLLVEYREAIPDTLNEAITRFTEAIGTASGQVIRVARRFGLVAAALELATGWGLLPFSPTEGTQAVTRIFIDWRQGFAGGGDDAETEALLAQVRAFIEAHGASRFERLDSDLQFRVMNRAGFIRSTGGDTEFLVLAETMRTEVCRGFDMAWSTKRLLERGIIVGESGRSTIKPRVPGMGTPRCYRILASALFAGTANDAN